MVTLSRPGLCQHAQNGPEHDTRIVGRRHIWRHRSAPSSASTRAACSISSPISAAGHHAEIRQHRIAPADARFAKRDVAEPIAFGDLLQFRAGIGDGDEP